MKKITRYLSLLAMALLTVLPSVAGGITSLDEISSNAAYVIRSARGYMVYAPQYAPDFAWCSQNTTNGATPIDVNENEPNNQWAIINSPKGFSYLWNVGAQKFLYKKDPKTVFSAKPLGGDLNFMAATGGAKADYPWVVAFGGNQLNMSIDQAASIFSNWNSTSDEGNMVEIKKVADLSAEVLAAANAAIAEYEKDIVVGISSLDQLKADKSYYVMNPRGDWAYVPEYADEGTNVGANMLVATTMTGVPAELAAPNKQFAFVKAASGNRYLYSVGAKKYVAVSSNEGETGAALVATPVEKLNFLKGQGAKLYPWVLALNEKQIGVSTNYKKLGGIITFYNDLKDEGNNVMVVEGDAFDATLLESDLNAFEEGLKQALATALGKAKEVLAKVNEGKLSATEEQKTALNDAVNAANAADITKDDYKTLVANLEAAVAAIPAEPVPAVVVSPDPAKKLSEVPSQVTMTFANDIKSVDMAMVSLGMNMNVMLEGSQIAVDKNVVTLTLPKENLQNVPKFALILEVLDVNGNYVTYGNFDTDMVYVEYEVAVPANRFACSTITPAAGKVESLYKFDIAFNDPTDPWGGYIGGIDFSKTVVLRDELGEVVTNGKISVKFDDMSSIATVTLDKEVAEVGNYTLVIPEGSVYNQNYNENADDKGVAANGAIYNPELTFAYTIAGQSVVVNPDPANGILKTVPNEITFTFSKEIKSVEEAMVVMGMGSIIPLEAEQVVVNGKVVTLKMPVEYMEAIPQFSVAFIATDVNGKVITYGNVGEGYVGVSYEVVVPANIYKCTAVDPAEGDVASLKTFKLTFTNNNSMFGDNIGGVDASKEVVLKDANGKVVAKATIAVDFDAFSSDAVITLDKEINAEGKYTLVVPEATIYNSAYNGEEADKGVASSGAIYNPELNLHYTVVLTGIESALAEDAEVEVYDLKGIKVDKSMKNLPKGIYIVNGKKVVVK